LFSSSTFAEAFALSFGLGSIDAGLPFCIRLLNRSQRRRSRRQALVKAASRNPDAPRRAILSKQREHVTVTAEASRQRAS
jgi:hypothetical protein